MTQDLPTTARSRARAEITGELLVIARQQLALGGAASLSLRAIAREAGMVSSAIYRYYPSRDDLLTALIVHGYADLADAVEAAESKVRRSDVMNRWRASARAVRAWATENPHDYGLLYGTPVPGYVAPEDTVAPVLRLSNVLTQILTDAAAANRLKPVTAASKKLHESLAPVSPLFDDLASVVIANGIIAWSALFGAVSFELFGHLHGVVADHDTFFEYEVDRLAREVIGLT